MLPRTPYGWIYAIINNINQKIYVGQTKHPKKRWGAHKSAAKKNSYPINRALTKYGTDNFTYQLIEPHSTLNDLNDAEAYWIRLLGTMRSEIGYNIRPGGNVEVISEESRKKMSEAGKGRIVSEETRQKISATTSGPNNHAYGIPKSETTKQKLRQANSGRYDGVPRSKEIKQKIGKANETPLTILRERSIADKYVGGLSFHKLAKEFNIDEKRVKRILLEHGIPIRKAGRQSK
jgi:group I intron endonuclease